MRPLENEQPVSFRFKLGILLLLCLQNAGHALLARFSQSIMGETYSSTEVVLVAELMKVVASAYLAITDKQASDALPGSENGLSSNSLYRLMGLLLTADKVIILVVLYSVANLLSYYALARVDAAVYTVLLQLKILSTAAFFVLFLGRSFSGAKWRALLLLVLGCILVASPAFNTDCAATSAADTNGDEKVSVFDASLGVGAILVMVTISGYSAVYFEAMLKRDKATVWERNFQLATYSAILLISILISDRAYNATGYSDFFKGWTISAFLLAVIQAGGGILVAATLKYADSILKTLATSGSIVLSAVIGHALLDGPLDIFVSIGCVSTILAIFNYTLDATSTS
jgi:UDP-sugar transporter A1/2/3